MAGTGVGAAATGAGATVGADAGAATGAGASVATGVATEADAAALDDAEILPLISRLGFSTAFPESFEGVVVAVSAGGTADD